MQALGQTSNIEDLVRESSLIFSGTVLELGVSSVANLAPRDNFAVVRVSRVMRSDPALGDLRGKLVTVELLDRGNLRPEQTAVFFTSDWIHGGGIASRELAHLDVTNENEVTAEVARLPQRHLAERVAEAVLVVVADVTETKPTPFDIRWRNAPQWAISVLRIATVLRGQPGTNVMVLFPTTERPMWARAPRLRNGQRAVFLLQRPPAWTVPPEEPSWLEAFTALDPADVQPESQLAIVEILVGQVKSR
jgi:hypothetical protein